MKSKWNSLIASPARIGSEVVSRRLWRASEFQLWAAGSGKGRVPPTIGKSRMLKP